MKKLFQKAVTVLGSFALVGATISGAAIAGANTYPAPFDAGNYAVVYGTNNLDYDAAMDIAQGLPAISGGVVVGEDESVKLERSYDAFNLGDKTDQFWDSIRSGEFPKVLADGVYLNDDNNEYEYEQSIKMGELELTHFVNSRFNNEEPLIGFDIPRETHILNYTLEFTQRAAVGGTEFAKLKNTEIEILGKPFFISDVEYTTNGVKMTLLDSASSGIIRGGGSTTVDVGGKSYVISIDTAGGTDSVRLLVNGESTGSLKKGQTRKLADGTHIGVTDLVVATRETDTHFVEVSLGTGEFVFENSQGVLINGDRINSVNFEDSYGYRSDIKAFIQNDTTNINSITLQWSVGSKDIWVSPDTELNMHGFDRLTFSMTGVNFPSEEVTSFDDSSDSLRVNTVVRDGALSISLLYSNTTKTGFGGIGARSNELLVTNATVGEGAADGPTLELNWSERSYFVATWISGRTGDSYAFALEGVDVVGGKNQTTISNLVTGEELVFAEPGRDRSFGGLKFTVVAANADDDTATIRIDRASSGKAYADRIITADGMQILLPVEVTGSAGAVQEINFTVNPATWVTNITEADRDGNIASAATTFNMTFGPTADGVEPTAVGGFTLHETARNSREYIGYNPTALATKVVHNRPSTGLKTAEVTYHGSEVSADVYLSAGTVTKGDTGYPVFLDTQKSSFAGKNLIVVGGSCANAIAAELLDGALCGDAFTGKTDVSAGQFLIETFSYQGKIATLVAGYHRDDTSKAATYLANSDDVSTTVGSKIIGQSATEATIIR